MKYDILYDLPGVFNFYKMVVTHRSKLKLRSRKIFAIVALCDPREICEGDSN